MRKRHIILLGLLVILLTDCRHKEFWYVSELYSIVRIVYDWTGVTPEPSSYPESMDAWLFDTKAASTPITIQTPFSGGNARIPYGSYNCLAYNNDSGTLLSKGTDRYDSFEVYTRTENILSPLGIATRANLNARGAESERVSLSPDPLWIGQLVSFDVVVSEGVIEKVIKLKRAYREVEVEVRGIDNYSTLSSISGALSGLSGGLFPGTGKLSPERVTVPFECEKIHAGTTTSGGRALSEDSIVGSFICFGHCPDTERKHYLTLYAVLTSGEKYMYTYDVTEQVHSEANLDPATTIRILIDKLPLPEPISGGDGLSLSMDEWFSEDIDINMGHGSNH